MKTLFSLIAAASAGYIWGIGYPLLSSFLFLVAYFLSVLPANIGELDSDVWAGIESWSEKGKKQLSIGLFVTFAISFFLILGFVDRIIDVDQAFGLFGEFAALAVLLVMFCASAAVAYCLLVVIAISANRNLERERMKKVV